jgi:hypothetical protein
VVAAVPVPVSAVMVMATLVVVCPVVAVSAGDAAGEDLGYLHAVSSLVGWDGVVCPLGLSLWVTERFPSGCR